jgi:dTDP-4-amino-4,6-dideoxygalactose transaminase
MNVRPEDLLLAHYDRALELHGDTPQGALWPNARDRLTRFDVMLDLLEAAPPGPIALCDLGCGTGELLTRLRERRMDRVDYVGVDRSQRALALARAKFPGERFVEMDITSPGADLSALDCDFLVANGLFTVRHELSPAQMRVFLEATVRAAWPHVRRGMAFNVMSRHVDWERNDLYHASMDDMAALLHGLAGRRVRLRADYGLYEFTCYAWRDAARIPIAVGDITAAPTPRATAGGWPAPRHAETAPAQRKPGGQVPVLRPKMPDAEALLPYLRQIDENRIYSNFGPLATDYEKRLAGLLGAPGRGVVAASSGTAGLVAAVLACAGRADSAWPYALMPSYTFVATAVAAQQCGFTPWLADVAGDDWMLDPGQLASRDLSRVGVVMPVSAYGRPVPQDAWLRFRDRTGIPVVIDGAAGIEAAIAAGATGVSPLPIVYSLHATKSLSSGEGGCIACADPELLERIGQALNFGFHHSRDSRGPSLNGKLSEYHAAVGLADLDAWPAKQAAFAGVHAGYERAFAAAGLPGRSVGAPQVCSSYRLLVCRDADESGRVQDALLDAGVDYRHWYGLGLRKQSWFADSPGDPLPVTEAIAPCVLGLPMAPDLDATSIERVVAAIASILVSPS